MAVTEGAVDTRQPSRVTVTKRRRRRSESGGFKSTDRLLVGGALATGLALALSVSVALCRPRSLSPRDARRLTAGQPTPAAVVTDRAAPAAGRDNADGSSRHPLSVRSRVSITALAAMVGIALPMGFLLSIQDRLVYKPTRNIRGKPDVYGMSTFEDVAFCTVDGHEIHGWFIRRPYAEYARLPTFIYFHGTDLNCSYRLPKAFGLYSAVGANVFLWSYRGYGLSEGFPSERGLQRDSAAMLEYLRSRPDVNLEQLWVYGESLGGAVAVDFVYRNQDAIRGLILENTFTALIDMIDLVHPYLRLFKVLVTRNKWITRDKIPHLKVPVLFLSGQRDGFVPPRMMEQLHALATGASRKRLIKFGQGTHNKTWMMPGYYRAIREFVVEVNGYDHEEMVLGKVKRENGWASDGEAEEKEEEEQVMDWDGGAASADGSSSTDTM